MPALPVTDALKRTAPDGTIAGSVERNGLVAVQTPQAFYLDAISQAHSRAAAAGLNDFPDDAAVAEWAGLTVFTIPGEDANIKLTNPSDFATAESMLLNALPDIRTGSGFDVHAFAEGEGVWLGGVRIAHTHRLAGHSDADVALHALTDAVLGAIAAGDIGQHFPPTDPQWKNAASDRFLRHAIDLVEARGGLVSHLDVTIICEAPRIGPHRDAIRTSIASIARLDPGRVSVKATTTEKLGFTGRREGIAAQAVATVRLPLEEIS